MRMEHFGDSYDFVKRSLLQCLSELGPWSIVPMFTDDVDVREVEAYRFFLLQKPVISTGKLTNENRLSYFKTAAAVDQNLFIDPNTGVRLTEGGKSLSTTCSRRNCFF